MFFMVCKLAKDRKKNEKDLKERQKQAAIEKEKEKEAQRLHEEKIKKEKEVKRLQEQKQRQVQHAQEAKQKQAVQERRERIAKLKEKERLEQEEKERTNGQSASAAKIAPPPAQVELNHVRQESSKTSKESSVFGSCFNSQSKEEKPKEAEAESSWDLGLDAAVGKVQARQKAIRVHTIQNQYTLHNNKCYSMSTIDSMYVVGIIIVVTFIILL